MKYDFDRIIVRRGTGAIKTDALKKIYGRDDLTALWVADMYFETPGFITDALKKRLEHSLFGYTAELEEYWPTVMKCTARSYGKTARSCAGFNTLIRPWS